MVELITTNLDLCIGCNRCIRECPMEMANVTYQNETGNIKVKTDHTKCIGCGRCVAACKHEAREFKDDTARFFEDLAAGIPISLMAAPAIRTNIPEYKRLFTYLKNLGIKKIYDVSLGADICIWAHVRHVEQSNSVPLITQPCPAIVLYCEMYRHDLLHHLAPIHSPMACAAVYMKQYEGITDRIAALSPCIAKSAEFADTELAQYNVTFEKLQKYLEEHNVELPLEETGFDHDESGLGALFPMPGGLKENILFHCGKNLNISKAEGFDVYSKLNVYAETPPERLPKIFDVLSCTEGCNIGPAVAHEENIFGIDAVMHEQRTAATDESRRQYFKSLYQTYDKKFDRALFTRKYRKTEGTYPVVTETDITRAFELLGKTDHEKQYVDCTACGSKTCYEMARKIALGVNIPSNCIVKAMDEAKRAQEEIMLAREHSAHLEYLHNAEERMRIMFDTTPLGSQFWDTNVDIIDCNQETLRLFNAPSKQNFLDNFYSYLPEDQPDGTLSKEKHIAAIKKALEEGHQCHELMYQTSDGTPFPAEVTFVRVNYQGDHRIAVYTRDLREQKRMMHEIDAAAAKLKAVIANYSGVIWCVNPDGIVTLFDGLYLKEIGVTPDFIEGKSIELALNKRRHLDIIEQIPKALNGETHDWISNIDGKQFRTRTSPIYDMNGKITGVAGSTDDISEILELQSELKSALKEADEANYALKSAQRTMSAMFEANPHINILFNSNFEIIDCNPVVIGLFGFKTKEDMLAGFAERLAQSIPPTQSDGRDSIPIMERFVTVAQKGFDRFETELILGGERRSFNVEFKKIPYEHSFAIVAYIFDITDIHKREKELVRARQLNEFQLAKLNLVVQATKIGLWETVLIQDEPLKPESTFVWSDEFRNLLGFSNEGDFPNVLQSWHDRLHPEDIERVFGCFKEHLYDKTGKTPFDTECRALKKNGEYAYYHTAGETIRDEHGNPLRSAGSLVDITEAKNILFETEQQKIEAEAASKAKSEFLSKMSHEIRTPMNAILGITEIQLRNELLTPETKEALAKIHSAGDLLLGIINDILDLSKIEAGKFELVPTKYDTASLINDVVTLNMMRIGSKEIKFALSVDKSVPTTLFGDELRIKQILNNILSNAIKYTKEGSVQLSVFVESKDADNVVVFFEVKDTGLGMSEEQVSQLFDAYTRFNLAANRSTEGTGLGMNITQNLVRLMNGVIVVKSEVNKGSTVTVQIPQQKIGADVLGRELAENLQNFQAIDTKHAKMAQTVFEQMPDAHVLVVDDVESNLYVAKGLLARYGLSVETATSGYSAIDKIKEGNVYDVIFMDHMMPKMDGIEATKIIRGLGYTAPIVALTANVIAGQADVFLANGFDDCVSKPIDVRLLNAALKKFVKGQLSSGIINPAKQPEKEQESVDDETEALSADPQLIEFFLQDAHDAIATLQTIQKKHNDLNDDDIRMYIIRVHGMKSALAYIGATKLAELAKKLEIAGRTNDTAAMVAETPAFLNRLCALVAKLTPKETK